VAGNATFPRVLIRDLQKAEAVDLNRAGLFSSAALQQVVAGLMADADGTPRSGFFGTGFSVVPKAGGLDCEVVAGLGFQHDTTGLGTDESPYRVLQLAANKTIQVNGGAPAPNTTYYVWAKYGSQDTRSENRLVRPSAGQPFGTSSVATAHEPNPSVVVNTDAGYGAANKYEHLATVAVPEGGATSSAQYTITDRRTKLNGGIVYLQTRYTEEAFDNDEDAAVVFVPPETDGEALLYVDEDTPPNEIHLVKMKVAGARISRRTDGGWWIDHGTAMGGGAGYPILHGDESGTLTTTRRRLASGTGSVTFTGGWGTDPVQINLPNGFSQATGLDYHVVVTAHKSASPGVMFQVQKGSGHFDVEALDPSPSAARNDTVWFDWIALGLSS